MNLTEKEISNFNKARTEDDFYKQYSKVKEARKLGSSLGAIIEFRAKGVEVGLGDPIYEKLDSELARAMMTINAVKY